MCRDSVGPDGSRNRHPPEQGSLLAAPPPSQTGADLAADTDTEQVCSQGQEGAALFSICSNQLVSRGRKWVFNLHQSTVNTLPLSSDPGKGTEEQQTGVSGQEMLSDSGVKSGSGLQYF